MASDNTTAAMQLITFVVILSIAVSTFSAKMEFPDISMFYSEGSIIWTLSTTLLTTIQCKVDFVNKTTSDHAEFRRAYNMSNLTYYDDLYGEFTIIGRTNKTPPFNAMIVRMNKGGPEKSTEELLREYGNYACGIFSVVLPTIFGNFYELRVKTHQFILRIPLASVSFRRLHMERKLNYIVIIARIFSSIGTNLQQE
uniref:Putative lipocalin n=1 Tax=Rhipicephalus microplus TaxID=6941 RepID=A0A6G5A4V6_RHIMP